MTIPPPVLTLSQVLDTFDLEQVNAEFFVGTQIDEIDHHIVGGHIAAQALMAAGRTAPGRAPHSMHVSFLRRGDARHPVDFEVTASGTGGRGLNQGTMFNRTGELVCTTMLEGYFGRKPRDPTG